MSDIHEQTLQEETTYEAGSEAENTMDNPHSQSESTEYSDSSFIENTYDYSDTTSVNSEERFRRLQDEARRHGMEITDNIETSRQFQSPELRSDSEISDYSLKNFGNRICWICLSDTGFSELDTTDRFTENYKPWIHPCKCRGTQRWVHQACLRRWIDMKQKGDLTVKVKCSQCKYAYEILKPHNSKVVKSGKRLIEISQCISILSIATSASAAAFCTLSGVGSIIAIRVCGQKQVYTYIRQRPVLSFFSFIAVPPALIFSRRLFAWELPVMKMVAKVTEKSREEYDSTVKRMERTLAPAFNQSKPRLVFGALATPIFGCYLGEKIFKGDWWEQGLNKVLRCLAGTGIYIGAKIVMKSYYLYSQNEAHKQTRIADFSKKKSSKPRSATRTVGRFQLPSF